MRCGWDDPIVCCEISDIDDQVWEDSLSAAGDVLWMLSGRRYGVCSVVLRPCRRGCAMNVPEWRWWSVSAWTLNPTSTFWFPLPCRCSDSPCACDPVDTIILPGPVREVTSITIDGVPFTDYVRRGRKIRRIDGELWPVCQDQTAASGDDGAFLVSYDRGVPLRDGGRRALGEMACELAKACTPGQTCKLPQRVQTIARQGVSMTVMDPQDFLEKGRTGLYWVDLWLIAANKKGLQSNSRVYRADA